MATLTKSLRQLLAVGDYQAVKHLVDDNVDALADARVRRDYILALDALGQREQSERLLAQQAPSFIDDPALIDAYLKRELARVFTEKEIDSLTALIESGGPAVRARRGAMELSVGRIDAALQSAREAIQAAANTQQSANLAASLGDLFFWHGRLELVDGLIDLVEASDADRTWLKAGRRFQLDFSDHASQLMRACLGSEHPHHEQARRMWFDHQWVQLGPSEDLLTESTAWSKSGQDALLEAARISMTRQLGMEDRASHMAYQSPDALAWHGSFLSLLDFVKPDTLIEDAGRQKLECLKSLHKHFIDESAPRLERAIIDRSLAIVGNAPSELGFGRGSDIDAHHTVVRFRGGGETRQVQQDYGRKTDIHVLPIANSAGGPPISKDVLVLFTVPYPTFRKTKWEKALKLRSEGYSMAVSPGSAYSKMVRRFKRPPSSGVRMAAMSKFLRGTSDAIDLFGFGAFDHRTNDRFSFYDHSLPSQHHDWAAEGEWLRSEFAQPRMTTLV